LVRTPRTAAVRKPTSDRPRKTRERGAACLDAGAALSCVDELLLDGLGDDIACLHADSSVMCTRTDASSSWEWVIRTSPSDVTCESGAVNSISG
jgi:hypothetical protein